jgi:hypothetical protein
MSDEYLISLPDPIPYGVLIPLFQYKKLAGYALIDKEDQEDITRYQWHLCRHTKTPGFSAFRWDGGQHQHVYMHRYLLGLQHGDGIEGDHVNGYTLDNRRLNLRRATRAQNQQNKHRSTSRHPTSHYRGVYWDSHLGRWHAVVEHMGTKIFSRTYKTEIEAAKAAQQARLVHFPFTVEDLIA